MRTLAALLGAILILGVAVAHAGPNGGGTLLLHSDPAVVYTTDSQNYCAEFALTSCGNADLSAPAHPDSMVLFYAFAAFADSATPKLKAVSFGALYDANRLVLVDQGSCGGFQLADPQWPSSGSGVQIVWETAQTAPLTSAYWFAAYVYQPGDTTSFQLTAHPTEGGLFADDAVPAVQDTIQGYGRLGFGTTGAIECPTERGDGGGSQPGESGGGTQPGAAADGILFAELDAYNDSTFCAAAAELTAEYGLEVWVALVPDGMFFTEREGIQSALALDPRVLRVSDEAFSSVSGTADPGEPGFAARVWNEMCGFTISDSLDGGTAFRDSVIVGPGGERAPQRNPLFQTSPFLLGKVGVSVFFMESAATGPCSEPNGAEDWTDAELLGTTQRMVAAFLEYRSMAPLATTSFVIDPHPRQHTELEPVRGAVTDQDWMAEAMDSLQVPYNASVRTRVADYNNLRRRELSADWWYSIFIVDDSCDADKHFDGSIGMPGVAGIHGPSTTMLSWIGYPSNEQAGRDRLVPMTLHETAHIFGAADEYTSSCACNLEYGYLHVPNRNCANEGSGCIVPNYLCNMDQAWTWPPSFCEFTRRQLGWQDSDYDGVYDPIDHPSAASSAIIGEDLELNDVIDIFGQPGDYWVKRIAASERYLDRGAVLWDGINYNGLTTPSYSSYSWTKNGSPGQTSFSLTDDLTTPTLDRVEIAESGQFGVDDTLVLRFTDSESGGGLVRALATQIHPDPGVQRFVIADSFYVARPDAGDDIRVPFQMGSGVVWDMEVRVWTTGAGGTASENIYFPYAGAESPTVVGAGGLSHARPNPSSAGVVWVLEGQAAGNFTARIISVDGRCIREWSEGPSAGADRQILWDGRTGTGVPVPAGRYFLSLTRSDGQTFSGPTIIVR